MGTLAWGWLEGRRNPGWQKSLDLIRKLARGRAETFREWRDLVLAEHLDWARAFVPFWRHRIAPHARLADVPPLTREDLQTSLAELVDERRPASALLHDASGGSTGQPVRVVHDRAYWTSTFATEIRLNEQWGLAPAARTAYLWGDDRATRDVGAKARLRARLLGRVHLNAFGMDEARMAAFAETLVHFQPEVVQGYASALDLFAGFLLHEGRWRIRPKLVRSAAETLLPEQRARIEGAFDVPVRDVYGSRESASLAAQCLYGGFHVLAHGKVLEIVDNAGAPAPPGTPGRVLVTDLTNRAMALLRYENGDIAAWSTDTAPCPCGCCFPRLERVWGRTSDFVTTPSAERIHGEWFTHLFYGRADVTRFQVRQRTLTEVDLLTVGRADEAALGPVLAAMRARLGPAVHVTWRGVPEIPPSASGKHRFTVSDVPWRPGATEAGGAASR